MQENFFEKNLPKIQGVDFDYAKQKISDPEILIRLLKKFYEDIPLQIEKLFSLEKDVTKNLTSKNSSCEKNESVDSDAENSIEEYRTCVHSIKSAGAQVGLLTIFSLAKILETAARKKNVQKIFDLNPYLIEELQEAEKNLFSFAKEEEQKAARENADLRTLLEELQFYMAQMDIASSYAAMEKIKARSFSGEAGRLIAELSKKVSALDFDGAAEAAEKIAALG